jgi:hypothetical protein
VLDNTSLFCNVDDFCQSFESEWKKQLLPSDEKTRNRTTRLSLAEIMTIIVSFHGSGFRHFKAFYDFLLRFKRDEFPGLVSYNRFVQLMPRSLVPLCLYLNTRRGTVTGVQFIDSTAIAVCKTKRISRNKVFAEVGKIGKSSMGWFFGFKLHIIVNEVGELLAFKVTAGNVDDRAPVMDLTEHITGKLFGDKGYISQNLFEKLLKKGLQLITHLRKKMKNKLMPLIDKLLLRKRSLIETINDQLKNISQIEHSRHRSIFNFMVNMLAGLIAYTHMEKKPKLNFDLGPLPSEFKALQVVIV